MKYCKRCGVLYSSALPACPKCNPALERQQQEAADAPRADPAQVRRQWLALCIGIPALIGILYLAALAFRTLGG